MNRLFYGDNLEILRGHVADESVDLVYLDPPFNSNRSYNVIFSRHAGDAGDDAAQIEAFDDTWHWTPLTDQQYQRYALAGELPPQVADALTAFRTLLGENDALAYLVNMAPRLVELHRALKPTGSLYLHCDPTMSPYLRVLLDATFGPVRFHNEIIWKRTSAHSDSKQGRAAYGSIHDVILFYTKDKIAEWTPYHTPYDEAYLESEYRHVTPDGRRYQEGNPTAAKPGGEVSFEWPVKRYGNDGWVADLDDEYKAPVNGWTYMMVRPYNNRYWAYSKENLRIFAKTGKLIHRSTGFPRIMLFAEEMPGIGPQDIWTDIPPVTAGAAERLGYQTQKPLRLLERIIGVSSKEGDVVLDPFCGCGTTIDAAQRLKRRWIGIDIAYIAVDLMEKRLQHAYGSSISGTYDVLGIPRDMGGAQALFQKSPFDFERWAVSRINAQPNLKQVGDKGVDGVARFYLDKKTTGRVLASVKGGKAIGPQFVLELLGAVETQKAQMGVLITMAEPTPGVLDAVNHGGTYTWPVNGQAYPRIQVITVADLLHGKRPNMPPLMLPYIQAARAQPAPLQMTFDEAAAG